MRLDQATPEQLHKLEASLSEQYHSFQQSGLSLDLTRGKPSAEQLTLSNGLDSILNGQYTDSSGTDLRNYGGLDGIPEAKTLFSEVIGVNPQEILIGGNSSLTLMYFAIHFALHLGVNDSDSAWINEVKPIKFLAPVPGYDRHFSICEHLGIELLPVAMNDDGPDMDQVEALLKADPQIKGIWCVPRFSNPTGIVYSDEVVARIAKLGLIAGENFRVFWDNAYAVHVLDKDAPQLANLMDYCRQLNTQDSVYIFGSTSKITFAGAGVAFMASSPANLAVIKRHMGMASIGPDKINQLRHVKLLKDQETLKAHMAQHAAIMKPRFDAVLERLNSDLADSGIADWTEPRGGYFISFNTQPGLAREVIRLAAEAGVKLTPAGATFPYGKDPENKNIRIAPTYP
ncbi:MAG: aminotransferase class I/II-fold pyridoxal phosphate-dependent enzyme, partial [Sedimenticola sp.]